MSLNTLTYLGTYDSLAYVAVFQPDLGARDSYVAMLTVGLGQSINVHKLWSWNRRQGDFLGVGISPRIHPIHGQSSQLRLVSALHVPSTQFYGDSAFGRYRVDEAVVYFFWRCFSGQFTVDCLI